MVIGREVKMKSRPEVKMQGISKTFPAKSFSFFYIVVFRNINKFSNVDCTRKDSGNRTIFFTMLRILEVHNIGYMVYGEKKQKKNVILKCRERPF